MAKTDEKDWLAGFEEEAPPAEVIEKAPEKLLTVAEQRQEQLRNIEDELLQDCLVVVGDCLAGRDIDPTDESRSIPEEWKDSLAPEDQVKRLRVARAAWLPPKEAPVFFVVATKMAAGIVRARAMEKQGPKSLNVAFVQLAVAPNQYPVLDVTGESVK